MFVSTGINFVNTSLLYKIFYNKKQDEIIFYYINGKNIKIVSDNAQEELNDLFESYKEHIVGYLLLEEQNILLNKNQIEKIYISGVDNKRLDIVFNNSYIEKVYYNTIEDCKQGYDNITNSLTEETVDSGEYVTPEFLNEQLNEFSRQMGEYFTEYVNTQIETSMANTLDGKLNEALDEKLLDVKSSIDFLTGEVNKLNNEVFGEPV